MSRAVGTYLQNHIELPVPLTPLIKGQLKMKSIAVPASTFIFKYQRIATASGKRIGDSGKVITTGIPVIDEAGLIVQSPIRFEAQSAIATCSTSIWPQSIVAIGVKLHDS